MKLRQNTQIAIAFLKKICRLSKLNQDKFKDFMGILNEIELGATQSQNTTTKRVKEQIKKALKAIRTSEPKAQSSLTIQLS